MVVKPDDLIQEWRKRAVQYKRDGAMVSAAMILCRVADELETSLLLWQNEELTIREAAEESGYSHERLREMVREGKLPDARPQGSRVSIKVRRRDLPRKARNDRSDPVEQLATAVLTTN
jgi:excisionase family DNA binding protein